MSPEILLTMAGIVLAILAITPRERLLHWRLRMTAETVIIVSIAVLLLHYITFTPVFEKLGFFPNLGPYRWGFDAQLTSYLIFVVALITLLWRFGTARLSPRKLPLLAELVDRLVGEGKYADLFALVQKHFAVVVASCKNSRLSDDLSQHAANIVRRVSTTDEVAREIAKSDPPLGLIIIDAEGIYTRDFLRLFVWSLLDYRQSVLYYEVRHNQNNRSGDQCFYRYHIPAENKLISSLLGDAARTYSLGTYKPIGDYGIRFLKKRAIYEARDDYNFPVGDYFEYGRWDCPIHTVIRLFDIMVLEALHQNVLWHMWLYYLPIFVEEIEKNIDTYEDVEVDMNQEWPSKYHFLLYEIFDVLLHFIKESTYLPEGQENIALENQGAQHENDNIPKSAALAIGQGLRVVLESSKITTKFKSYILEMQLREIKDLKERGREGLAMVLGKSVLGAGPLGLKQDANYYSALVEAVRGVDFMVQLDLQKDSVLEHVIEEAGISP